MAQKNSKSILIVILIFLLAFSLRLGYTFFLKNNYFFYNNPSSDVTYYREWAHEIAKGDFLGKEIFYGLPLYPYFLALIERLSLGHIFAMRLIHLLLGSINCLLLYFISKKIFNQKVGILSAFLASTNFILIYYDWLMMPVTLIILLSQICLLSLLRRDGLLKRSEWFILGLIWGTGILGDGKLLFFLFFSGIYLFFYWNKSKYFKLTTVLLPLILGVSIILGGVTLRNKVVGGEWIFICAQSGLSLYAGNNPDANGIFENPEFIRPTHGGQDEDQKIVAEAIAEKKLTASQVSQFWRNKAISFITEQPLAYLVLLKSKFLVFFTETERAHDIDLILQQNWRKKFDFNPFYVIMPLALVGLAAALFNRKDTAFLNLLILSQLTTTLIFFLTTRHRASLLPVLIIFQSYGIFWLFEKIKQKNVKPLSLTLGFLIIFLLLFEPQHLDSKTITFLRHAKSGPVYEQMQDYESAKDEYYKALEIRPTDSNTLYNLGTAYLLDENLVKAEEFFLKALKVCHYNVDALFNLGYIYEQKGNTPAALKTYLNVLEYQPQSLDIHYRLAHLYHYCGDCQNAHHHYSTIIKRQPQLYKEVNQLITQCRPDMSKN